MNWPQVAGTLLAVIVGSVLTQLATILNEHRQQRRAKADHAERERTYFTGLWAIRNFIASAIGDAGEGLDSYVKIVHSLEVALKNLNHLIERMPATGEALINSVFDISLKLDVVISAIRENERFALAEIANKIDDLIGALEGFDIVASQILVFIQLEDVDGELKVRYVDKP